MMQSKIWDRLYLQRSALRDIFVDLLKPLPQHQIDGIRFLFRQYQKKAPGVILNDPPGYGKCLQTVLFLSALQPLLKKPILILSDSVDNWKEHFELWTNCNNDVAIRPSNPFLKKLICVNPIKDGLEFSRRVWGIVVVHDEGHTSDLLMLNFNADYKLWITSDDLKDNLYELASIYEWLYPNQKFNVELFHTDGECSPDIVKKALHLDAFLEDFFLRRTDFQYHFRKPEKHKPAKRFPSPVKATRKNKDPTGLKVKRTKHKIAEDVATSVKETTETKGNASKDITNNDNNENSKSFINNEIPIECDEFNFVQNEASEDITVTLKVPESMDIDFTAATGDNNAQYENTLYEPDINLPTSSLRPTDNNGKGNISREIDDNFHFLNNDKISHFGRSVIAPATEDIVDSQSIIDKNDEVIQMGVTVLETETENDKTQTDAKGELVPNVGVSSIETRNRLEDFKHGENPMKITIVDTFDTGSEKEMKLD